MRWLANYLRQVFCRHEWEYEETEFTEYGLLKEVLQHGTKVSTTCKRCGYHKSYWKFG